MQTSGKIYVAGHTGMVGSAIVKKLKEEGFTNIIGKTMEELDLTDQQAVAGFFRSEEPEYVILAAAKVGGILANDTYRAQFIYENLMIQNNIIHASYTFGVKKLLFLGSSCIYPKNCPQPIKEEYLLTGELEQTNEPYAIAKIAGIKMCENYHRQYNCNFISVMPTNLYGPNDNYNLETSHVLPALIRKIHLAHCLETANWDAIRSDLAQRPIEGVDGTYTQEAILMVLNKYGILTNPDINNAIHGTDNANTGSSTLNPLPITLLLWGSGKVYREFLHVEDMAAACIQVFKEMGAADLAKLNPDHLVTFLNIGSGIDQTITELAHLIKEIVGFKGKIMFDHIHADGTFRKLLNVSRLNTLGFKPKYTLREGIQMVYENYKKEK